MILIVDDDSTSMIINSKMVSQVWPRDMVGQFMDSGECYNYFNSVSELPQIIFCDYEMPGDDGYDVYKYFKKKGYSRNFYLVTSRNPREIPEDLLLETNLKVIRKPVLLRDFKRIFNDERR